MIKLLNEYNEVYYMKEETKGTACGCEFTEVYIFSEELGEKYGTVYRNAVNDSQPNVWKPYEIKDNTVVVYEEHLKRYGYNFKIAK